MSYENSYSFVSYAHKDSDIVVKIIEALDARTFNIWYDNGDVGIKGGEEWPKYIAKMLKESDCCICFMSRNYVASKNCRREFNYADKYDIPTLVVFLEDFEVEDEGMDMQISLNQCISMSKYTDYNAFIDKICNTDILQCCRMAGISSGTVGSSTMGTAHVENMKFTRGNETYIYTGYLLNGLRSGPGKSVYASGDVYDGEYKNDKRNGFGTYTWACGNEYAGNWKDGNPSGRGKYTGANGESFNGELKDGRYHGSGSYVSADGSRYDGTFENGVFHGFGRYIHANGDIYEGGYIGGKKHGKGKLRKANGALYQGEFKNGLFDGYGKYIYAGGDVYEGEFRNGKRHGRGKYVYANGRVEVGKWVDDKNVLF